MISAMVHLGGDSFRTASVFIAAITASTTNIPIDLCDAWAAIGVSFSILLIVFPLCVEICKAAMLLHRDDNLCDNELASHSLDCIEC